ncbi:MAG: hypothetical protein JST93_14475 [Acidobacteria bacterium]|nr:hypothetical protein [Acidobacteriota bacterium]
MAGSKLTPLDVVRERVRDSIDIPYLDSLYNQALYLVGASTQQAVNSSGGDIPWYADINVNELEIGRSRRMLSAVHIVTSRLLSNELAIDVREVPDGVDDALESYFRRRMEGGCGEGGWVDDIKRAGIAGNALGMGVVQVGLVTDRKSGYQKVTVKSVKPWYCIFDAAQQDVLDSDFVCFVNHYSVERARKMFPNADVEKFARSVKDSPSAFKRKIVRVLEYYDKGDEDYAPTRVLMLGTLDSKIFEVEPNVFECLPVAVCLGWDSPASSRPHGRVMKEVATELAIHDLERRWDDEIRNGLGVDVVDVTSLDENGVRRWEEGSPNVKIRQTQRLTEDPIKRIPNRPLDTNVLERLRHLTQVYQVESGISELDRGLMSSKRITASEIDYMANVSQANKGHEAEQITLFLKRLAEVVLHIGTKFDRCPLTVKVRSSYAKVNDPGEPRSWLVNLVGDYEYRVYVDAQALTKTDLMYQQQMNLAQLRDALPLVGRTIDELWFTMRWLELIGEEDPSAALKHNAPPVVGPDPGGTVPNPMEQAAAQQIPTPGGVQRIEDAARAGVRGMAA